MAKGNFIEAEGLVKKLNEAFTDHVKVVQMAVQTVKSLNDEYKKLPSDYAKGLKDVAAAQEKSVQATKNLKDNTEKLVVAKKKEVQTILDQSKSYQGLSKQKETSIKQAEREASAIERASNVYNKVQAKVNALSATYNNLAIKKELGLKLNDRENAQLASLETRLNKYQSALKAVDANIQKHQRNVGNYAGSFNGLGNSINQITRELPAFTFSAQTGFLALSNNIPILTDEIGRLVEKNKELAKQGQPVKSVFSQILSGVFSLQTAMGVGILLFTLYGKEIGSFVSGLMKGGQQLQTIGDQINQLSEARKSASELASREISELDRLYKVSQDLTLSIDQRKQAVDKLQELYPNYLGNINDENILNGKAELMYYKLRDAILAKYTAQAIGDKLAENAKEGLEDFLELQQRIVDTENEIIRLRTTGNDLVQKGSAQEKTQTITISNADLIIAQERLLAKLKKDMLLLKDSERDKNGLLIKTMEELLQKSKGLEITETKATKTKKENTTAKKENNKETEKELQLLQGTEAWYEKQISSLKQIRANTADTTEEYKSFNAQLAILEDGLKALRGELTALEGEGLKLDFEEMGLTAEGFEAWRKQGTESGEELTQGWQEQFQQWAGVATDAINVVQEAQQRAYQQELGRLEKSRDNAILFAGESSTARAEIDRQYDEKRTALLNKQAKQQKAMAIVQAVINTATAVIGALPNIPLSIAVGIIGAAQIALIASQQVPQFYKGTDNAPEGMAWTQERGAELITDKHGKVKSLGSNKGAQLTHLNKGDKVFNAKETKSIMFNNELNGILMNNGISNASTVVNNNLDLSPLNSRLDNLTNVIKNKPEWSLIRDVQGERLYQKEQGVKKLLVSNRLRIKS